MKTYEELCDALRGEEIELSLKIEHLENFLMTEEYQTISTRQKELLTRQLHAMQAYKGALIARVLQARFEHRQEQPDDCKENFKNWLKSKRKQEDAEEESEVPKC